MLKNMGGTDQFIRVILAVVVAVLIFTRTISGLAAIIPGLLAIVFLVTGLIRF
jgi:hypothetical protein